MQNGGQEVGEVVQTVADSGKTNIYDSLMFPLRTIIAQFWKKLLAKNKNIWKKKSQYRQFALIYNWGEFSFPANLQGSKQAKLGFIWN